LNASILEIFKSKQKLQSELNDINYMNDTSQKRFSNLSAIQYKSQEKTTAAHRDLAHARAVTKTIQLYFYFTVESSLLLLFFLFFSQGIKGIHGSK